MMFLLLFAHEAISTFTNGNNTHLNELCYTYLVTLPNVQSLQLFAGLTKNSNSRWSDVKATKHFKDSQTEEQNILCYSCL